MLLRHRVPGIESRPANTSRGFEHLDEKSIAVLRWLQANRVEFVLVGEVGEAIRGHAGAGGPVAIVPAPYGRNLDRLARALSAAHATMRMAPGHPREHETVPVKMNAEKLARGIRWELRCGAYDIDVEGRLEGVPRYQELLYEAGRFEIASDVSVEVASPEDLEHFAHIRRTGTAPEIRIVRRTQPDGPSVAQLGDPSVAQLGDPSVAQLGDPSVAQLRDPSVAEPGDPPGARTGDPSAAGPDGPSVAQPDDPSAAQRDEGDR
jgi:hypothetical protein